MEELADVTIRGQTLDIYKSERTRWVGFDEYTAKSDDRHISGMYRNKSVFVSVLRQLLRDDGVFYHGTSSERVESILENGLDPSYFGESFRATTTHQHKGVFLSSARYFGGYWAQGATPRNYEHHPVILAIDGDALEEDDLTADAAGMSGDRHYHGHIPPSAIEVATEPSDRAPHVYTSAAARPYDLDFERFRDHLDMRATWMLYVTPGS